MLRYLGHLLLKPLGLLLWAASRLQRPPLKGWQRRLLWAAGMPERAYNFGTVVPDRVYRSGLPDERFLRHVIRRHRMQRLITITGRDRSDLVTQAARLGLETFLFKWTPFQAPDRDELNRLFSLLQAPEPVLVHCTRGRERSGFALGAYRVCRQGWTFERAHAEMRSYGFEHWECPWARAALRHLWKTGLTATPRQETGRRLVKQPAT